MAKELAQDGQDIALAALVGAAQTAAKNWIVPLTADPGTDRAVADTDIYPIRFLGADPVDMDASDWTIPSGTSPDHRERTNGVVVATAAASGLGAAVDVSHYAVVRTSDNLVPNDGGAAYTNVTEVVGRGPLDAVKESVNNGDVIEFAIGSISIQVD